MGTNINILRFLRISRKGLNYKTIKNREVTSIKLIIRIKSKNKITIEISKIDK